MPEALGKHLVHSLVPNQQRYVDDVIINYFCGCMVFRFHFYLCLSAHKFHLSCSKLYLYVRFVVVMLTVINYDRLTQPAKANYSDCSNGVYQSCVYYFYLLKLLHYT